MQICMKLTSEEKRSLLVNIRDHMEQRSWNISDLARNVDIHQSQVSRILAGDFKTLSSNVIKICITFEIPIADYRIGNRSEDDRREIANSALAVWNGTHQDAGIVISLFKEIARLRRGDRRR
jgi:hypothetical protein